jgi:hypothetical protein
MQKLGIKCKGGLCGNSLGIFFLLSKIGHYQLLNSLWYSGTLCLNGEPIVEVCLLRERFRDCLGVFRIEDSQIPRPTELESAF